MNSNTCFHFGFFSVILVTCVVTGSGVVIDCYATTVYDYIGHQQTIKNGTPCIRWDSYDKKVYTNEQFRDVTVSDAANFCRDVDKNYLWCWTSNSSNWGRCGIKKCENNGISKCGNLKIEQPALLGRNVTFTFTPDSHDPDAILEWQRADRAQGNPWYTRPLTYKFTQYNENGTYYMVLTDSLATKDEVKYRIHYYNESMHCWMEAEKLKLDDNPNNPCGFVYLRNERVLEGENVYLEYYPSKVVMKNPDNFARQWVRSKNGSSFDIKIGSDNYIESNIANGKYTLTFSTDNSMNGNYSVNCGREAGFTNNISVVGLVPPSTPEFVGLQDIDDCKKCIVGSDKENIEVHCKTSGGTPPVEATVTVGDKQFPALHDDVDTSVYKAFITLTESYHNATITCSVMNDALSSPLITTAKVYVIKPPANVRLSVPKDLREGSPVHITCLSPSTRPLPEVYFNISGIKLSSEDVNARTTFINATSLYSTTITLTTFKREWNGKNIVCCSYNKWYNTSRNCSEAKQVNFIFPPSDIQLEIEINSVDPLRMYAVCTLNNSNPVCMANFTAANIIIGSERNSKNTSLSHGAWKTEYVVNLNVSKEDNGKDVTCAADCEEFQDLELRDTKSIKLPYRPVMKFNISGAMLDITKGERAHVKCTADSVPVSNISWIEMSDKENKIKKQCDFEKECVLDVNADVISKQYFVCAIRYLQMNYNKTLIVNIYKSRNKKQMSQMSNNGNGTLIGIIVGICSALVVIVVVMVIVIKNKRNNEQAKHKTHQPSQKGNSLPQRENEHAASGKDVAFADDQCDVTYSQPIKKKKVAAVCDETYAEVDKTRKRNHQAKGSAAEGQRSEDGQLMYVDLEFNADGKKPKEAVVKRRDSPTEYVGIDFAKTAAYIAEENDTEDTEMGSIYVNQ